MTKILDCTIRDGGHLCGWNFEKLTVDETYRAACKTGIDYFEIGYRMHKKFQGPYSKCPEDILPEGICKLVVMVNVSDFDINDFKKGEPFLVRAACHHDEIRQGIEVCEQLKEKGFNVFLHLMNTDMIKDFSPLAKWDNKEILESVYFADSFGSFTPDKVEFYYKKLQNAGFEKISFHGHNNLQLAFANSLKAIELGAYSVDGTVYGMGRGAGNLPIELLIGHLKTYDTVYYHELIEKYFIDLHKKYNWGYNLNTLTTGLKNIHPSSTFA